MAFYRKDEFIKLCGIQSKHLTTFIARGNVIVNNDLIDDSNPVNRKFIEKKRFQNASAPTIAKEAPTVSNSEPSKKQSKDTSYSTYEDLERQKKALDIEKITVETRLLVLREEKIRGEVLPVGIVNTLIMQLMQNVLSETKNISDNMISVVSKKASLNVNEIAVLRGEQAKAINLAVDKAIEASKKQLSAIINEFSVKKEVGEHE